MTKKATTPVEFAAACTQRRERIRELLQRRGERLRELESRLIEQVHFAIARGESVDPGTAAGSTFAERFDQWMHQQDDRWERQQQALVELLQRVGAGAPGESADQASHDQYVELQQHDADQQQRLHDAESRCQQLEKELADAAVGGSSDDAAVERLIEQVDNLENLRFELQAEVADLKTKLKDAQSTRSSSVPIDTAGDGFDWESQKLRMLAQLEDPGDGGNGGGMDESQRLSIDETIRKTDQIVADKNEEIEELKRLLSEQSAINGDMAVGAAAFADLLDQDELILEERDNLRTLQEDWREKLRQAEVDISMERAKLARERAQMEEQKQFLEDELAQISRGNSKETTASSRGRWLSRLGLSADDD